jgi:hypothetical protein
MSFAWTRRIALGSILLASACKGSTDTSAPATNDAGTDAAQPLAITFTFDPSFACAGGGLCAPPSQVVAIAIGTTAEATVSVALEGSYGDAALTADHVTTTSGYVPISLETSSMPSTFTIVARAGTDPHAATATLTVAVGATGVANVRASPSYAGKRANPGFFVAAIAGSTCADIDATPPTDATWVAAAEGTPTMIPVTAEQSSAIAARIGHYATGCADIGPLAASVTRAVSIDVYDVPMALGLTDMDATFTSDGTAMASWVSAMTAASATVSAVFFGASSDGTALLDAVRTQVPAADQTQFDTARSQGGWNATASTWLSSHTPTIHDRAATFLTTAAGKDLGAVALHLGTGPSAGTATVTPTGVGALSAQQANLTSTDAFAWTADADDTVHLVGTVTLSSSPYIGHLADSVAAASVPSPTSDVPGAIASQIDCQGLSTALVGAGYAYGTCGATCLAYVCENALAAGWTSALASPSNGSDGVDITLTLAAAAEVGDEAEPQYFQGGWLGTVAGTQVTSYSIKGTAVGEEPASPTP